MVCNEFPPALAIGTITYTKRPTKFMFKLNKISLVVCDSDIAMGNWAYTIIKLSKLLIA